MTEYTLGFVFNKSLDKVLLIELDKPGQWNDKLVNGVGGKLELEETFLESMQRECLEESSLYIEDWKSCGSFEGKDFLVEVFCSTIEEDKINGYRSPEGTVMWYKLNDLPINLVPNAEWMIPLTKNFIADENYKKFKILS